MPVKTANRPSIFRKQAYPRKIEMYTHIVKKIVPFFHPKWPHFLISIHLVQL